MTKKLLVFWILFILSVSLVSAIKVLTVDETDLVKLKPKATDEDQDNLTYYYSDPLDDLTCIFIPINQEELIN